MTNISVSKDHLEAINEQLIVLGLDAGHLALALQSAHLDCAVSRGVIHAVRMALGGQAALLEDLTDQLDSILSAPQGVTSHD